MAATRDRLPIASFISFDAEELLPRFRTVAWEPQKGFIRTP
ncbi:hypothetical protein [Phormidium pseudopriestleyi]|nr:hypothetical protein [Phormidium pseudopriestleyi]